MKRNCKHCGTPFEGKYNAQKYCCQECANIGKINSHRERQREQRQKARVEKELSRSTTLADIAVEARNAGMSYGKYVAAMKL